MTKKKLQTLRKKHQQLKAQIHALEAAEKSRERKRDTRRKILIGAYYLEQAKKNGTEQSLYQTLLNYVTREIDKKLFIPLVEETDE